MNLAPEPLAIEPQRPRLKNGRSAFTFRHRGLLGAVVFLPIGLAVLFSAAVVRENSLQGAVLNAAGWLAFLIYAALRVWATLYVGGRKDQEMQTEGPYSICRNPLYLGSLAFAIAAACFLKSIVFAAALLPAVFLYLRFVVRAEEHYLERRFQADYRDYCRRTPRFWPRWSAFRTRAQVSVELKRLKQEFFRLSRAAGFIILLQVLVHLRAGPSWPHWFSVP
jgi:protein-S-isoprenylcysteine O-methyltransferase Ste14